jgi:hypothetical protein
MKNLLLISTVLLSTSLFASKEIPLEAQISSFTVEEVSSEELMKMGLGFNLDKSIDNRGYNDGGFNGGFNGGYNGGNGGANGPTPPTFNDRINQAGKIIQATREMVALGEAIYELVKKGKPTNVTQYAPISVVPRDPETMAPVYEFDLEGFSIPVQKTYVARVKNGLGKEVVSFSYQVTYSYGGSYNGTGKWLSGVMIVPGSIRTTFGWDFNATMNVGGIMNHGSKENPVAGVRVIVKYQMNSWSSAFERNDSFHITGDGKIQNYMTN